MLPVWKDNNFVEVDGAPFSSVTYGMGQSLAGIPFNPTAPPQYCSNKKPRILLGRAERKELWNVRRPGTQLLLARSPQAFKIPEVSAIGLLYLLTQGSQNTQLGLCHYSRLPA